jgi:hypothetical protein
MKQVADAPAKRPLWLIVVAIVLCVGGGAMLLTQFLGGPSAGGGTPQEWYTIDDGKSFFADDVGKFPPFIYKGKPAYRCAVWTCDDGKTKFVSHLERIPPEVKMMLDKMETKKAMVMFDPSTMEVKLPQTGDQGWVSIRTPQADEIMKPKCPGGGSGTPKSVLPP